MEEKCPQCSSTKRTIRHVEGYFNDPRTPFQSRPIYCANLWHGIASQQALRLHRLRQEDKWRDVQSYMRRRRLTMEQLYWYTVGACFIIIVYCLYELSKVW